MCSKRHSQGGFTLIEMVVTGTLFIVMAAMASLLISKLAPSYMTSVEAEQALSPREAALWRVNEDFRQALLEGSDQTGCTVTLNIASGVDAITGTNVNSQLVEYQWVSAPGQLAQPWVSGQLSVSALWTGNVSRLLLGSVSGLFDNIWVANVPPVCPFNYVSGVGTVSRVHLNLAFQYSTSGIEPTNTPVSMTMHSYVNGPYVASAVLTGNAAVSSVSVSGYFPGMPGIISSVTFVAGTTPISSILTGIATNSVITANVSYVASTNVDVKVTTPEGWSVLRNAFQFPP